MKLSRRSLLLDSAALGALSTFLVDPTIARSLPTDANSTSEAVTDGERYWSSLFSPEQRSERPELPNENRDVRIAHLNASTGIRWVEAIKAAELPVFEEDSVVTMEITGFRAGKGDRAKLARVKFAQLHLVCQRVTGSQFLGPIAWVTLATIFADKASKLPPEQNLEWNSLTSNPNATNPSQTGNPRLTHMILSQGAGHMMVAVATTPLDSPLGKVLALVIKGTKIMSPLLGLPGITVYALQSFYTLYGKLEQARTQNFLLNSEQKDVAVTQHGLNSPQISANALKLISGDYILVPKAHEEEFQKTSDNLVVQNGYVVARDTKGTLDDRIATTIPGVTYVTMNVRVQPVSSVAPSSTVTDPLFDSLGNQSTTESSGKSQPKKRPN